MRIPKAPEGFATCNAGGGWVQTNHLVRDTGRGTPGPTLCGLTRFDSEPGADDADIRGWSIGGGLEGPGVEQVKCYPCWNVAEGVDDDWRFGDYCCLNGCCGPGSWCCMRALTHAHNEPLCRFCGEPERVHGKARFFTEREPLKLCPGFERKPLVEGVL